MSVLALVWLHAGLLAHHLWCYSPSSGAENPAMSALDYDFSDEIAEREFVDNTIRGVSQDGVRGYFGTYGDAVYKHMSNTLAQAEQLRSPGGATPPS
jgi:hypothetical protein